MSCVSPIEACRKVSAGGSFSVPGANHTFQNGSANIAKNTSTEHHVRRSLDDEKYRVAGASYRKESSQGIVQTISVMLRLFKCEVLRDRMAKTPDRDNVCFQVTRQDIGMVYSHCTLHFLLVRLRRCGGP